MRLCCCCVGLDTPLSMLACQCRRFPHQRRFAPSHRMLLRRLLGDPK
jgi:hypothetical protein